MEDFGSAFTGQAVEPAQAQNQWDSWLDRPGNRTALLQFGLQLMQPQGIGQTTGGQIGQAVGAAGEALTRQDQNDLKAEVADAKIQAMDERLRIAQQRADTADVRATRKGVGGLTELFKARAARQDQAAFERQLDRDAADLVKQSNDVMADPNSDVVKKYKGKTRMEIRDMLRAERPKPQFGAVPSNDPQTETPQGAAPTSGVQPPAGFQQYSDGQYYKPDPSNPGKFLRWRP